VCSYVLASSLVARGVALLAPIALTAWFSWFFWVTTEYALIEVWAAGFGLAAMMCLVRGWKVSSLVLLTAAVAAREFMVLLIPAWILVWWLSEDRRGNWWLAVTAIAGPAVVLVGHFLMVPPTTGAPSAVDRWMHGGLPRLLDALRYGYGYMPGQSWIPLAIAACAIAAAALAQPRWKMAALLAATALPTLFLFSFSGGTWQDYWGGFFIPLAASIAPGVLGRLLPPEAPASASSLGSGLRSRFGVRAT
jgi:hypothetical protein